MITYVVLGLLTFIAIASITVYIRYDRDMDVAHIRLASIPTEVYTSQYGDIEYRLVGNGPVVLVSHGVTGGIDQGMSLTDQSGYFGKGYRFLYISRFGYLKSSLPKDATARLQAAVYKDLLDYLGIDQVFVFGNSAGGPSAMWFAIDYPERTKGLILLSSAVPGPLPKFAPKLLSKSNLLYWAAVRAAPDMIIGFLLPKEILSTLSDQERAILIDNVFMASLPITERTTGFLFDNEVSTPSVNDVPLEQIETPTLILQAVDDPREKEGGHELAESIPDSEFVGLTGGHFLLRQESKVQTKIAEFIAKQ